MSLPKTVSEKSKILKMPMDVTNSHHEEIFLTGGDVAGFFGLQR